MSSNTANMLDLSAGDKPRQIQENLIAYMRLFADLPGMVMVDGENFWFVSHKPAPGNTILRTNWSGDVPNEGIEARLDALFQQVGQHIDAIDWLVFPHDRPADLSQRLEARGMPGGTGGNWLWADVTALKPGPTVPENFHIEQVGDDRMMAAWVKVSEEGFGQELPEFYDAYARHGYGPDAFSLHYIGYVGDTPVTSGTLLDAGGCPAIYDISTPPDFRRQGFGGAITYALLEEIRDRGYSDTWILSSDMAKGVYQKLGFIDTHFGMREHEWHKQA